MAAPSSLVHCDNLFPRDSNARRKDGNSEKLVHLMGLVKPTRLPIEIAKMIANYVTKTNCFGAAEWKRYFGIDVGLEHDLPDEFYTWWLSPDIAKPDRMNYETHLSPVLRPRWITETDDKGKKLSCYSLKTLERLVQYPKEGPPSKYTYPSEALQQHGNAKAGPARWLVMRKDLFARNRSYARQKEYMQKLNAIGAVYDEMPSVLDLATIVFAIYMRTGGDRYLGDSTGRECRLTSSHCKERATYNSISNPLLVGMFSPLKGLCISSPSGFDDEYGVAGLREF